MHARKKWIQPQCYLYQLKGLDVYVTAVQFVFTVHTSFVLKTCVLGTPKYRASVHGTVHATECIKVGHVGYHWKGLDMP